MGWGPGASQGKWQSPRLSPSFRGTAAGRGTPRLPHLPCAGAGGSSAPPDSPGFFTRSRRGLASGAGSAAGSCRFFFSFCPH